MRAIKTQKDLSNFYNQQEDGFNEAHIDLRDHLEDGIYLLKNGDLGVTFKFCGIYDEILTHEELEEKIATVFKSLRSIILGIPSYKRQSNSVVQLHYRQRALEFDDLEDGRHEALTEGFLKDIIQEEERFILKTNQVTKRNLYISIRFCTKSGKKNYLLDLKNFFQGKLSCEDLKEDIQHNLKIFKEEIQNFEHILGSDFSIKRLNPGELIDFYQKYFDFCTKPPVVPTGKNINLQLIIPKITDSEEISTDLGDIKCFYIDQIPAQYRYGQFRLFLDQVPLESFDISWNISHGQAELGTDLIAKEAWYSRKPNDQKIVNELQQFRENIDSTRPYVTQSIRLIAYNLESNKEGQLISLAMDYLGSRLVKESQIPIHILASSLAMNCLPIHNKLKGGRCRTIRLENALSFAPLYVGADREHGVKSWLSRQGTLASFDLFCGQGNRMSAVLAMSRAGKSVLNANLILEFLARYPKGIVRVIDKKSSYQKLGDLIGGRVISFSESALKTSPYSPFALSSWDEDDIENLYLLISTALIQKNKSIEMTACHAEVLRESIKLSYNNHAKNLKNAKQQNLEIDPHPVWSDILSQMPTVCENLKASGVKGVDQARDDLAKWSVNLYPTGQYGFLFSSYEKEDKEHQLDRFLTYDLDGISDEVLRQLAAMMAFIKIGRDLAKLPRSTPKLIIFEELGMLLHGEDSAQKLMDEFIHMVIKTCAKLNAQAISITNDVKDYTEKAAGRTIWGNSTQKIFMPLGDLFDSAKKAWSESFNEADFQIMKSLKKEFHHKRSQAYIYSNNEVAPFRGTILIPLSSFNDALCTTSAPQVELYSRLRESMSCKDALIEMAKNHPYGEGL